jgi:sensor histidine kinase YesM
MIPLFLLGTVAFFVSQHMIEKKYSQLNEVTLKSVTQNIDNVTNEVNQLSNAAIVNPTVQKILSMNTASMTHTELALHKIDAEKALKKILYTYPFVYSVTLYDRNGVIYNVGRHDLRLIPYQQLIHHPVFSEVKSLDGKPEWLGPYQYPKLTGKGPLLTQIRIVKDIDTLENKGVLILQTKLTGIGEVFKTFAPDNRYLIAAEDGRIFYDSRHLLQGQSLSHLIDERFPLPPAYQTFKAGFNGQESLISVNGLNVKEWRVLSVRSWHSLSKEVVTIVEWITVITAICLISALLFNILFVNRIAQSIIRVVRLMKRVEDGDLGVQAKVAGSGETKKLTVGFNSLIARMRRLLQEVKEEQERKKKAEMMLLEAQIQPHFLFNTLESINALAVQNEGKKVSRMIQQLGRILRITIETNEEIPVRQEIDHLQSYLAIQNYRFEEMFDYEIDIPDTVMNHLMLKLTLQPLVENAIQHAFIGLGHKGKITVYATEMKERIEFFIKDNGTGIPENVLHELQFGVEKSERKGLGIRNVSDRLRIRYGKTYGLLICTQVGEGTIVKCTIPKYKRGDDHGAD